MKIAEIIKALERSEQRIFTLRDLQKLLKIQKDNTTYKTVENLIENEILIRLKKGLYRYAFSLPEDFEIANSLYSPSYISLETSLNFYGILSQFPYTITSITPRKTEHFEINGKKFDYIHIQKDLFFDYRKEKTFLIAYPEKALVDTIYLVAKRWRDIYFT